MTLTTRMAILDEVDIPALWKELLKDVLTYSDSYHSKAAPRFSHDTVFNTYQTLRGQGLVAWLSLKYGDNVTYKETFETEGEKCFALIKWDSGGMGAFYDHRTLMEATANYLPGYVKWAGHDEYSDTWHDMVVCPIE